MLLAKIPAATDFSLLSIATYEGTTKVVAYSSLSLEGSEGRFYEGKK